MRKSETSEHRSWTMSRIRSKNTGPEMRVRRLVHSLGYRYRLHRKDLPGKPDIVFGPRRKIIEVRGCFWHAHSRYDPACREVRAPVKTNTAYWGPKIDRNVARDAANLGKLTSLGWNVLVIWECELRDIAQVERKVRTFIESCT
ncbi:very short patch repair endonuclease [Sinorhizobium meliloti]|uniref:very short patch repair endonuclease n=1 Tax=Rhizobium meliloti TaxID=382 RepID=UPI000FDC247A|nr:very short patch repair endonuclease [Sinorhizobium meliloti]RVO31644.1 DNA mismatch endonuclease Vsr [Sinorhizobium meliloti]